MPLGFRAIDFLAEQLSQSRYGPILFVFDNFETVRTPGEIFTWIDTYVRPPNKVLITTRIRGEFRADYPVPVGGMSEDESMTLITSTSSALGIQQLITDEYSQELIHESGGHPYVMKVLLGEVAKARMAKKVERIVANQDDILTALFERTYANLAPVAQRVFLTLCNWRSTVPEVALEAVLLRPQNERMNVRSALDELVNSSFIEEVPGPDGEVFVNVPLAASLFGRKKLAASPWKAAAEADSELLQILGPGQKSDARHGIDGRLYRLFRGAAKGILGGDRTLGEMLPMLELIARKHPVGWMYLADLHREIGGESQSAAIKSAIQHYLENPRGPLSSLEAWRILADECRRSGDALGELHAISELCKVPEVQSDIISSAANRVNAILSSSQSGSVRQDERDVLVRSVANSMEKHVDALDAIDFSRLSWLYIRLANEAKALELAQRGLEIDPTETHCRRIVERLSAGQFWR